MKHWYPTFLFCVFSTIIFVGCSSAAKIRLLSTRGVHTLEYAEPCRFIPLESSGTVKELKWEDTFAFTSDVGAVAKVICREDVHDFKFIDPVRLELSTSAKLDNIKVGETLNLTVRFYDRLDREIEVGKFTVFNWSSSPTLNIENDSSAGEFGFCSTCYGQHRFRAIKPGKGVIKVQFDELRGSIEINVK